MEHQMSRLRLYSLGTVAANKPLNSNMIEVTPIEDLTMVDGEISDNTQIYKAKGVDRNDADYQLELNTTSTITAEWMPIGSSNRATSPDVRRGEMVAIYRFGDTDKYYWTTFKNDLRLRKLETVIYAFSGTTKETDGVSPNTHYFLEISTHNKTVTFHTSKGNGEPFAYDVQFNTKEGFITIQDDDGNFFTLDSTNRRIEISNRDGNHTDIDKRNYTLTVPDNTTINTGQNTQINSGADTSIKTAGTTTVTSAKNIVNGPTEFHGPTTFFGPMVATGSDGSGGGDFQINGNMRVEKISTPNIINTPGISGVCSRPA